MKCSFVFAIWCWTKLYSDFESCNFTDFFVLLGGLSRLLGGAGIVLALPWFLVLVFSGFSEPLFTLCLFWVCPVFC